MRRLALLLVTGCVAAPATQDTAAPLVGVDGSLDQADRSCDVVLRSLEGNSGTWTGVVEISAAAAAEGLAPSVLYTQDSAWHQATVTADATGATPGYAKFDVRISAPVATLTVEPYLALAGGGRLFDHNRNAGDFANYVLAAPDYAVWGAPATCGAPLTAQAAKLVFGADGTQHREGVLAPGGTVEIDYATSRLAGCRQVQGGHDLWALTAHLRFDPAGELRDVAVTDGPGTVPVPTDARGVAVWFEATSVSGCHQWDSNDGANYVFAAATPPAWLGLAENLLTRDASDPCDGGTDAASGLSFDTWARQRAAITNLCFQVYQPGVTDTDTNPWQALDASVHWKLGAQTAWTSSPASFDRRDGNNARFTLSWRGVDPFRAFHCPEVASTPTSDGMYQQIGLQYYIVVNGAELRPESGAAFGGSFIDYPGDAWRTANCGSSI